MTYLAYFHHIRPLYELSQEDLLRWIAQAHQKSSQDNFFEALLKKIGLGKGKIQKRGCQLQDMLHEEWEKMEIFRLDLAPAGLGLQKRMEFFQKEVFSIFEQFYPGSNPLPPHIIHATCTGYASPSGAQKLVSQKKACQTTQVLHAYHMGCYASFPALRIAQGLLMSGCYQTDIVHTEIASLHMNPSKHTQEQLVIETLFSDGFIKYTVTPVPPLAEHIPCFHVLTMQEEIIPDSTEDMSWICHEFGFCMHISKKVPLKIQEHLLPFLMRLAQKSGIPLQELLQKALFAIHPGGPKIIDLIQRLLSLRPWQFTHSQQILETHGNMSSATLPHIWEQILLDPAISSNTFVVSLAFGPGLTFSGGIFEKH